MDISFVFVPFISEVYKQRLQTFVDGLIAQGFSTNRPPRIRFPGMYEETFFEIWELRDVYGF